MLILTLYMILLACTVVGLYHLRNSFGLGLLYVFVAANQFLQTMLTQSTVTLLDAYPVSIGSAALFSSSLMALLLVYFSSGVTSTRRLLLGIAFCNVSLVLTVVLTRVASRADWIHAPPLLQETLEQFGVFPFLLGTVLLLLDSVLMIAVYAALSSRAPRSPLTLRLIAALSITLIIDELLYLSWTSWQTPNFTAVLTGHLSGKVWAAILFGGSLGLYIQAMNVRNLSGSDEPFAILTYQERFHRLEQQHRLQEQELQHERQKAVRAQLESQEQLREVRKLQIVSRLAGSIAHEFNNQMTVVLGYAEMLLQKTKPTHSLRPELLEIRRAGEAATETTRQLLEFSRGQVCSAEAVDLNRLLSDSEPELRKGLRPGTTILQTLTPGLPNAWIDARQTLRALKNLIDYLGRHYPQSDTIQLESSMVEILEERHSGMSILRPGRYLALETHFLSDGAPGEEKLIHAPDEHQLSLPLATALGIIEQSDGFLEIGYHQDGFRMLLPISDGTSPPETDATFQKRSFKPNWI